MPLDLNGSKILAEISSNSKVIIAMAAKLQTLMGEVVARIEVVAVQVKTVMVG